MNAAIRDVVIAVVASAAVFGAAIYPGVQDIIANLTSSVFGSDN